MIDAYSLPTPLVQAIVQVLNEMPARATRALLNAIEAECLRQDEAAAAPPPRPSGKSK